ncbi:MAG: FixH family protein [Terriglobales bacterium]
MNVTRKWLVASMAALLLAGSPAVMQAARPDSSQPAKSTKKYKVSFRTEPQPPKGAQENTFYVGVTDPSGQPVSDAKVTVEFLMPAMPEMKMPAMRSSAELSWKGREYVGKGNIATAGPWKVTVKVTRNKKVLAVHKTDIEAK